MARVLKQLMLGFILLSPLGVIQAEDSVTPVIPKGLGDACIADNEIMRKNHMDMLQHDRDLTVHEGIRDIDASLNGCISCHQVKDENGQTVSIKDERHFCRVCHDYAAVQVDCFQCHASKPEQSKEKMPTDKIHSKVKKGDSNP